MPPAPCNLPGQHTATRTWSPRVTRNSHRWLPTKPAPPVTSTRLRSTRGLVLMTVPRGKPGACRHRHRQHAAACEAARPLRCPRPRNCSNCGAGCAGAPGTAAGALPSWQRIMRCTKNTTTYRHPGRLLLHACVAVGRHADQVRREQAVCGGCGVRVGSMQVAPSRVHSGRCEGRVEASSGLPSHTATQTQHRRAFDHRQVRALSQRALSRRSCIGAAAAAAVTALVAHAVWRHLYRPSSRVVREVRQELSVARLVALDGALTHALAAEAVRLYARRDALDHSSVHLVVGPGQQQ